jgi:large subunit ribosomal protein L29
VKIEKLREMAPEALVALEREQREKIFKVRFQHSMGQLESSAQKRTSKRDLARTLTIAAEKRTAAQGAGAKKK